MRTSLISLFLLCALGACTTDSTPSPASPIDSRQADAGAPDAASSKPDTTVARPDLGAADLAAEAATEVGGSSDWGSIEAGGARLDGGMQEASGDSRPGSGLARERLVGQLTPNEAAMLCDFTNLTQGGYGKKATCPGGEVEGNDESLGDCVTDFIDLRPTLERCRVTVGHMEDCARAVGTDLCKFATAVECGPLTLCM